MTISLSTSERPNASYRCLSTYGIDTHKFHSSFRNMFWHSSLYRYEFQVRRYKFSFQILPYRYFYELLVLYLCFQSSRQISFFRVSHLVRKPRPYSHQWVILAPQASIIRRPQGFCYWPLYDDTRLGTTHSSYAFHDIRMPQKVDVTTSIPIATILLFLSLSARLKHRSSLS